MDHNVDNCCSMIHDRPSSVFPEKDSGDLMSRQRLAFVRARRRYYLPRSGFLTGIFRSMKYWWQDTIYGPREYVLLESQDEAIPIGNILEIDHLFRPDFDKFACRRL